MILDFRSQGQTIEHCCGPRKGIGDGPMALLEGIDHVSDLVIEGEQ